MSSRGSQQVAVGNMLRLFEDGTIAGLSEGQLLDRFVSRSDSAAFEALVDRHGPMVWGVCKRVLADPNDVDDAFQATFLVLAKKAATIRDQELLGNWLYGVAHRISVRARSDAAKRRGRETPIEVDPAATAESLEEVARLELAALIQAEVARLPEKYRLPVVLCDLSGHTHEEAALRLDCPVGTVKGRQSRARDMLKQRLVKRGFSPVVVMVALGSMNKSSAGVMPLSLVKLTTKAAMIAATGRVAALGVVSIHSVSLMQGAITAMSFSTIKLAAAGVLTAGFVVGGAVVFAGSDLKPFDPQVDPNNTPNPSIVASEKKEETTAKKTEVSEPLDEAADKEDSKPEAAESKLATEVEAADELDGLQSELIKQAKKSYKSSLGYLNEGRITLDRVYEASLKLLQAEGEENLQALTDHAQRMKELQLLEVKDLAGGRGTETNLNAAMTYALEAKLKLAQFKAKEKAKPAEKIAPAVVEEGQEVSVRPSTTEQPKKRVSFEETQRNKAKQAFEKTLANLKRGDQPVSAVNLASEQWSSAEANLLDRGQNFPEQIRIRREHLARMIDLDKVEGLSGHEQDTIRSYITQISSELDSMERTLQTSANSNNRVAPPTLPAASSPPETDQLRPVQIPVNLSAGTTLPSLVLPPPSEASVPTAGSAGVTAVLPPSDNTSFNRAASLPPAAYTTHNPPVDVQPIPGSIPNPVPTLPGIPASDPRLGGPTPTPGQDTSISAPSLVTGTSAPESGFAGGVGGGGFSDNTNPEEENPLTVATLEILKKPIKINFKEETALNDVLSYLKTISEDKEGEALIFYIDPIALQESERTETSTVKIDLEKVSMRTALRLLLTQLDLTYFVQDGIVIITNEQGIDRFRDVFNRSEVLPAGMPRKEKAAGGFVGETAEGGGEAGGAKGGMGGGFRSPTPF